MMVLWRISNYADLKGIGGQRAAGRWHFAGQPVVYLAEHPAAALLEILVHLEIGSPADLPDTYQLLRVEVADDVTIAEMTDDGIPANWRDDMAWSQDAGTEWLGAGGSVLLKVPSAVVPYAHNYLMNPEHEDAGHLTISMAIQVRHDSRILKLLSKG
ncbi:RES family NAD+ phosphorylase (plasmid) [Paraburkholderia sprentiae WSM5005]|uniref:RES family NAD+ phosphorylase n=1 Tax=Paraburkholderia sprentiae WSM5005 TaxID=754502 RepID=A0A1I9YWA8_9BURK|nr:RES family NAD+ phosphorylase [Paraburkholderia sprentiae]APA90455.2 RES family NAD+ phosphorylase [Paraburkholderia sprentiae WSM5005]